jgi:methylenetetrahydrofolate dehydrogenase (NADP+)/methenyltetrahydrofolate cyclohydrolase
MIILDGKKLAQKILDQVQQDVAKSKTKLQLGVVVIGYDPVVQSFVNHKKKKAIAAGIKVKIYNFSETITTDQLQKKLVKIVDDQKNTGVIVQLPLPPHIEKQIILNTVKPGKDVDVLSDFANDKLALGKWPIFPPVAGAIKSFFEEYKIKYKNKNIAIAGRGDLVGKPAALWLQKETKKLTIINRSTKNVRKIMAEADIIISGVGQPSFITGRMVKKGVVIIDAGTSESKGVVVGDADFKSFSKKASYITPVPGGIGPMTVAILLQNLVTLSKIKKTQSRSKN